MTPVIVLNDLRSVIDLKSFFSNFSCTILKRKITRIVRNRWLLLPYTRMAVLTFNPLTWLAVGYEFGQVLLHGGSFILWCRDIKDSILI